MQKNPAVRHALTQARQSYVALLNATSLAEAEDHWVEFLHRLDRIWNKAEAHFCLSPKWRGWSGPYSHTRRKDPLLRYMVHARNCAEHGLASLAEKLPGSFRAGVMFPKPGASTEFRMMIDKDRRIHIVPLKGDLDVSIQNSSLRLLPVENRGVTFPVPSEHLGRQIDPANIPALALLGLEYYEAFVTAAEEKFY